MTKDVRTGIAVALFFTSLVSAAMLVLNPRFADPLSLGLTMFLVVPIVGGALMGVLLGRQLRRLAHKGTNEDPVRATEMLWATFAGFVAFFVPLAFLPSFLSIFSPSETLRYGGALILSIGLTYLAVRTIHYVSSRVRVWVWPLLVALPVAVVILGGTTWGRGKAPGSRVLALAVPGLSWDVAEEMIERGEMPNLSALRKEGAWGDVRGSRPLIPSVVWTSVATGKHSEEHGAVSFAASTDDIRSRRIWEILEARGWSVGLFGWPATWPPREVDGFVVPAVSDPGTETYPGELTFIRELAMSEKTRTNRTWGTYCRYGFLGIKYGARLGTITEAFRDLVLDPIRGRDLDAAQLFARRKLRAKINCDTFVELRRRSPTDFAAYYTNIVHVAQSYFWRYHEPDAFEGVSPEDIARYGDSVHDSYRIFDEFLGRILKDSSGDEIVLVISDHGAEAITDGSRRTLSLRVEPALEEMRLHGAVEATNLGARTYLRHKSGQDGNQERIRRLFDTARLSTSGHRAFQSRVDEWGNVVITVNAQISDELDDTLLFQGGRCLASDVIRAAEIQESSQMNEIGALVMRGRGIAPGRRFEGATIFDIVPTILVLNDLDLAVDLPGDVIASALEETLLDRMPGFVATYDVESPEN